MDLKSMFSKKCHLFYWSAAICVVAGFLMMAVDPVASGFGVLTRWIAPPLLLAGFILPVFGIAELRINAQKIRGLLSPRHLAGYFTFLCALAAYVVTLEPTASLWDCGEFIASAYKLQVPHTPGTPLSLLIGRFFTMFAFDDVTRIAWTMNLMSALFSALTVYLLYDLIFYFSEKVVPDCRYRTWVLVTSSSAGALVLAFSDTFWFTAVEAETYGLASFFLLLLVRLIVTLNDRPVSERGRRLVLTFYLAGLGYCIHPMCLLALPLLPFSWFNGGQKPAWKHVLLSVFLGMGLVFIINRFVVIGLFELAFSFDLFFVNHLRLPFYSGAIAMVLVLVVVLKYLYRFTRIRPVILSAIFLALGFTPYFLLFIRSNHNPPIDEANPENLPLIKAYMNRDSYPTAPLLYGPYFDARVVDVEEKRTVYYKDRERYQAAGKIPEYRYDARQTLLPRIYSTDAGHVRAYRSWLGLKEHERPGLTDNLNFMITYQIGHMYLRYLLWNFAGREGDEQNSSWLKPWQAMEALPFERARNQYWMIPLLAGVAGGVFQFRRDRRGFVSVLTFFLVTGVILALYLNSPPVEPRERDYIYVGSFIAFSIWIGIGMAVAASRFTRYRLFIPILTAAIPLWMLIQNFDDHNRSGRTFQIDNARNVLGSCAPNAILFTGGDNDTFPLWYLQDVEGFRTDVRIMVMSYMNTDWYINQLRRQYYDSPAFRLTLDERDYRQYGPNDVLYVNESIQGQIDFRQYLGLLKNEHPALSMLSANGDPYHILPARGLRVTASDTPAKGDIDLYIKENYVSKNLLALLDVVVSNGCERPVYFNFTSMNSLGVDVSRYVIQEGPVFRLRPQENTGDEIAVDTEATYRNIVTNADYSNLADSSVYFTYEDHFTRIIVPVRHSFNDLASAFLKEGNHTMASRVMKYAVEHLYPSHLRPSYTNLAAAELLIALGDNVGAASLSADLFKYCHQRIEYDKKERGKPSDLDMYLLRGSARLLAMIGDTGYEQRLVHEF